VCSVEGDKDLTLKGVICLEQLGQDCTADCGGGDSASCGTGPLSEGKYTLWYLDKKLSFEVPGTLPQGGVCVGGK
jgi:hypothetical protein